MVGRFMEFPLALKMIHVDCITPKICENILISPARKIWPSNRLGLGLA